MSDSKFGAQIPEANKWEAPDGANTLSVDFQFPQTGGVWKGEGVVYYNQKMTLISSCGEVTNGSPGASPLAGVEEGDYHLMFNGQVFVLYISTGIGNYNLMEQLNTYAGTDENSFILFSASQSANDAGYTSGYNLGGKIFRATIDVSNPNEIKATVSIPDMGAGVSHTFTKTEVEAQGINWPAGGFKITGRDIAEKKKEVAVGRNLHLQSNSNPVTPYGGDQLDAGTTFTFDPPAGPPPLVEKSKALNVYNEAGEKKMKMKYNAEGDFEIAVDDDKSVHIKKIKYGDAKQDLEGKINEIVASVSAEVALRSGQKSDRDTQISTLQTSLQAGIDAEEDRATLKENLLQSNIDDETGFRTTADTHLQNQINAHLSQANTNNANRLNQIIDLSNNLDAEKVRAISSEVDLAADISTEASTARAAEQANASAVATEKTRAEAAEAVNAAAISALINTSASGTGLAAEVLRATNAEAALAADISANYSSIHAILGSSPESLNSLQELVADYQANGQTVTTLVNDLSGNAMGEIASLKTQMAAVQATLLALQAP